MTDYQWSLAFLSSQAQVESKMGALSLSPSQIKVVNSWVRYVLEQDCNPDPSAVYFAVYGSVPPPEFGYPTSIRELIERASHVQGAGELTEAEKLQVDSLAVVTYENCKSLVGSNSKPLGNLFLKLLSAITLAFFPGLIGLIWCLTKGDMKGAQFWGLMALVAFVAGTIGGLLTKKISN